MLEIFIEIDLQYLFNIFSFFLDGYVIIIIFKVEFNIK